MKTIFISYDHRGYNLKALLIEHLSKEGYAVTDCGPDSSDFCDYPDQSHILCKKISSDDIGILICNTGIGMSIAANRYSHIRAALCRNVSDAKMSREHNDANVLVLGSQNLDDEDAKKIFEIFIKTPFEKGRHQRRLEKI